MAALVAACASEVTKQEAHVTNKQEGQKFGRVVVRLSDLIEADKQRASRFREVRLAQVIEESLRAGNIYDEQSSNVVDVTVNRFRVRSGANAAMFGIMAGADFVEGLVTLKSAEGKILDEFPVSATYALAYFGPQEERLVFLGREFGKRTVETIIDKRESAR